MKLKTFNIIARHYDARNPQTIAMLEDHLVNGMSLRATAIKYGCTFQHVMNRKREFLKKWQAAPLEKLSVLLVETIEMYPDITAPDRRRLIELIEGAVL